MTDRHDVPALEHFVRLARRGGRGAASGGERRAHLIAGTLVDCAAGLDDLAFEGLCLFAALAHQSMHDARAVLDGSLRINPDVAGDAPVDDGPPAGTFAVDPPECCGQVMTPRPRATGRTFTAPVFGCDRCGRLA